MITIEQALSDPQLLGAALGPTETWETWLAVLKAAFGDKLNRAERRAFEKVAGSRRPPKQKVAELWAIVGRRAGKSRMAAAVAVFIACFVEHRLDPGEIGYVLCLAATASQAKTVFDYAEAFLRRSPVLSTMIETVTSDEIRLINGVTIAIHVSSYRNVRGKTLLAVIADETAYWRDDTSANPDREVVRAVMPSLASTGGMLVAISSPYRKVGVLYERHRDYYGVDDDSVLVISAPTTVLNPTIDSKIIEKAHADDPEAARAEWDAQFRSDISSLFDDRVIDDAIEYARPLELPPQHGVRYHAFTDASAGRHDAFTLAIGHMAGDLFICDVIRGQLAPFNPRNVAQEFAAVARDYGVKVIVGDAYAGEWVAQAFKGAGLRYETSPLNKSALYLEALPVFNRGAVSIPEHDRLSRELRLLERRVSRSGKDSVDHPRNGSDDFANALCGCLHLAVKPKPRTVVKGITPDTSAPSASKIYRDADGVLRFRLPRDEKPSNTVGARGAY
jgi:terminase large subunit-like protein